MSFMRGALFENLMIPEMLKNRYNRGRTSNFYLWRDRTDHEIEAIVQEAGKILHLKTGHTLSTEEMSPVPGLRWR